MRISAKQNKEFTDAILPVYPLDQAVEWINSNLDPSDVFTEDKLEAWAEGAGFKRES
jgi:hypothetical protein